jgi:hypothetical protein
MRPLTALVCLGLGVPLAGCLTAGPTGDATPELTAAAPAASAATEPAPPVPMAPAMPAGRAATAPKPPARAAAAESSGKKEDWKEGGVTREKINGMCWMKYESGRKDLPVEKRADLVNQCVIDTMKQYPPVN